MHLSRTGRVAALVTGLLIASIPTLATGPNDAVAKVDDKTITLHEANETALSFSARTPQDLYDLQKRAIDALVDEHLLTQEAKKRGVTSEALIRQEITSKVTPATEPEAKAWFDKNPNRVSGRQFDQIKGQIQQFIGSERLNQVRTTYLSTLRSAAKISVMLEPPRADIKIAENKPVKGPREAAISIIEYSDFQ